MSRAKVRGFKKQPVERVLLEAEKTERKVVQNEATGDFEVVHVVTLARYRQGKAQGPTTTRGLPNDTKNMAPKGKGGATPIMRKKGQG
jgi:hypothetical protein